MAAPGSRTARPRALGSPTRETAVPPVTSGSRPSVMLSCWPSSASTQRPSVAMPTGTTSYFSGSSAPITLPAETQEIACSALRPPKGTATRTLPLLPLIGADPSRARPGDPSDGVERGGDVCDQVGRVLDAAREPAEPGRDVVPTPLRASVDGAVHPAEA